MTGERNGGGKWPPQPNEQKGEPGNDIPAADRAERPATDGTTVEDKTTTMEETRMQRTETSIPKTPHTEPEKPSPERQSRRNQRRRDRYQEDPQYRTRVLSQTRETYRRLNPDFREENCGDRIAELPTVAVERELDTPCGRMTMRSIVPQDLARLMNRHVQVLYRWYSSNVLPRPVCRVARSRQGAYTEREAEVIMQVFSEHQKVSQYLRADNTETVERMRERLGELRKEVFGIQ